MAIYFPNYNPTYSASKKSEPLTTRTRFGDGYEQRVNFGFNQNPKEWSLSFNVSEEDADVIEGFLNARALDCQPFDWTPPDSSTSRRWICSSWTRELFSVDRSKIDVTFKQVFEPPSPLIYGYARGSSQFIGLTYTPGAAIYPGYAPGSSSQISLAFASGSAGIPAFAPGVNLQISVSLIPGAPIPPGYAPGANLQLALAFAPGEAFVPGNGPGANLQITLALASGAATGSSGGVPTGDGSTFWQYWKYNEADERILLYEDEPAAPAAGDGAAYWSDWRPFDDEFFFYGQDAAAASSDMPAYWNRWQSWTEDPPLIFEESA